MFREKLIRAWRTQQSLLCVGLDPDPARLPVEFASSATPFLDFCIAVVDATAPYCAAFKPQAAHFGAAGREQELAWLIADIQSRYPDHVVILDAKRGDIGSTAEFYAREAFERFGAHAVTVNPYLGEEAVRPYLAYEDRGVVVLCRTSNPGSDWLQNLGAPPVYLHVAEQVARWDDHGQCMLVTGATYPDELGEIRKRVGAMPLLVPGIGAQGGDLDGVLAQGLDQNGNGLLISSSRGIIYAASGEATWRDAVAAAARKTCRDINDYRSRIVDN